ncbi:hypothetical protein OH779_13300 [Actinacidiphila glaucinigra]
MGAVGADRVARHEAPGPLAFRHFAEQVEDVLRLVLDPDRR